MSMHKQQPANKLLKGIYLLSFTISTMIGATSCSNNKADKGSNTTKVKTYRVQLQEPPQNLEKLSLAWEKEGVKDVDLTQAAIQILNKEPSQKKTYFKSKASTVKQIRKKTIKHKSKVAKVRKPVKNYRKPRAKYPAPVRHIKYAKLSGDYSSNRQTIAFIDKMANKHGFDRGYLNYLFTKTKATPFLKRMAYADAHPKKRIKKRRSGRWTRYRGNFLTAKTINKGLAFAKANRIALQRAEDRYGVPKEYILGIIGVETRYGGNVGKNRAIDALSAMGFKNERRGKYFRSELEAYLLMTRKERIDPLKPMASYAGALGLSQFMPSNIKRYAVDHDHSGSVNLWTPADAIGSVANYFKKHGWSTGGTVTVKADSSNSRYKTLKTGFKSHHSLTRLKSKGISAPYLGNISGKASLIKLNTYSGDELWLGGHNFYVITRYNHSSYYAMAVHQLAQAIKAKIGGRGSVRQASLN